MADPERKKTELVLYDEVFLYLREKTYLCSHESRKRAIRVKANGFSFRMGLYSKLKRSQMSQDARFVTPTRGNKSSSPAPMVWKGGTLAQTKQKRRSPPDTTGKVCQKM